MPSLTNSTLNTDGNGQRHDVPERYVDGDADGVRCGGTALPDESETHADDGQDVASVHGQPMNNMNMYEQGAGQLNVDGSVKLCRTFKFDTDFNSVTQGSSLLQSGQSMPRPPARSAVRHLPGHRELLQTTHICVARHWQTNITMFMTTGGGPNGA